MQAFPHEQLHQWSDAVWSRSLGILVSSWSKTVIEYELFRYDIQSQALPFSQQVLVDNRSALFQVCVKGGYKFVTDATHHSQTSEAFKCFN